MHEPTEFIAQGDEVVVPGNFAQRVKSTNKDDTSDFAHIVAVADGEITDFDEFPDTLAWQKLSPLVVRWLDPV